MNILQGLWQHSAGPLAAFWDEEKLALQALGPNQKPLNPGLRLPPSEHIPSLHRLT